MDSLETEHIERDQIECDEIVTNEQGQTFSRYKDYWAWYDEIKRQLFNSN